ncbi:transposase [Desulfosarcina ovata]|uniref:transposase n=1 Tax=Desulfosarcina ovata TaxID=83564 RepID=UPI0039C8E417
MLRPDPFKLSIAGNGKEWINSKGEFLFPVKALSKVFRGKFISYLEDAYIL